MGIPAVEDGLFAILLLFDYLYIIYIYILFILFPGGCRPPDPPLGRADGRPPPLRTRSSRTPNAVELPGSNRCHCL